MAVQTTAGLTIELTSALPATVDQAGFEAVTGFTKLGSVESFGEFGDTYTPVTFLPLDDPRLQKYKGSVDPGDPTLALAIDRADGGQIVAKAALASYDDYSFKLTYQDGSIDYFLGKVMSFTTNPSGSDNILMGSMATGINSQIVEVAAP